MIEISTPVENKEISNLKVGDIIEITGSILCGRDAVLPQIVKMIEDGSICNLGIDLKGQVVFHTAVSPAGVGPTSSNKLEIEGSIEPLSKAGVKIHLGKGEIGKDTIAALNRYDSIYAVIPPVTALLNDRMSEKQVVAFPELGMEAFHMIKVEKIPTVIAVAHGRSIYDEKL